ncbi:hypothetical protein GCM10022243_42230 [Saccharothrix violaceirubra]|uniref:DUF885 domain-containing protein n=1 Tax=Saccharothrix violaceirubra TaxID=413306 RepID=A0A7W7WYI6_9PSEU|nr:DUF885 domain-containing protein [Saccharothrix violaceirubra]MBB4968480.1 hypothetical protein [Saccharothrix violaceirubra]
MDVVREYLLLGLRLGRLRPGLVDSYTGDPVLRRIVGDESRPHAAALAVRAADLRRAVADADLEPVRREFLHAQLVAMECTARALAGARIGFVAEVESYYQVTPVPGDQDRYLRVHRELDDLLPGRGPLAGRLADHRCADRVPRRRLKGAVEALSGALRGVVRSRFALPAGEAVEYEVVRDRSWSGFNHYLGGFRSRVAVNADLGHRMSTLPHLVAHESYPGHHTEHCRKEVGLAGHAERSLFLIDTPQCLMAEGLAELGLHAAVGPGWGRWAQDVLAELGLRMAGEACERVEAASAGLLAVRQDAALMLHDRGAHPDDVVAFLCRWLLVSEVRARQLVRFLGDPLWRAYTTTYVEGVRLLKAWLDVRPPAETLQDRYLRLLDEPLVPRMVQRELSAGIPRLSFDHGKIRPVGRVNLS